MDGRLKGGHDKLGIGESGFDYDKMGLRIR
jgi:hypothetical protein